jgi:hypothetical protein
VGSIPLQAALATRPEQATAAEAIIRRAALPIAAALTDTAQRGPLAGNLRSI